MCNSRITTFTIVALIPLVFSGTYAQEFGATHQAASEQAERALGDEPPPPLRPIGMDELMQLRLLPRWTRTYKRDDDEYKDRVKYLLAITWCSTPSVPPADAKPELEVSLKTTDFAPLAEGLAVITLLGDVKSLEGEEASSSESGIVPVAVQLDKEGKALTSYFGVISGTLWFAAVQLDKDADTLLVTFVKRNHTPVPVTWLGDNTLLDGRFGGITINRTKLVESHTKKIAESEQSQRDEAVRKAAEAEANRIAAMDLRPWHDKDGTHKWDAEYIGYEAGGVTLQTADGERFAVKLSELSREDQQYVRKLVKAARGANKSKSGTN